MALKSVELAAGTIDYQDTGGDGPVLVLLHGLLMDASLWDGVVAELRDEFRCVIPVLPMGGHTRPAPADADLSLRGNARLVAQLLEQLDLRDVTVAGNDTGGAVAQLLAADHEQLDPDSRIGRLVLVSCDAFDNFPPGLTGKTLFLTGKLPPALFGAFMQQLKLKPMRRMPISFGWLTKRGDTTVRRWLSPMLTDKAIRSDAVRALRAMAKEKDVLARASAGLSNFDRPALVVWAAADRVMPPKHGKRLTELLPKSTLIEVPDCYTLVPLDQPTQLARAVRDFAGT
jgi:pimeloyl-ACP methyl ester carboxylesterase